MKRPCWKNDGLDWTDDGLQAIQKIKAALAPAIRDMLDDGYLSREIELVAMGAVADLLIDVHLAGRLRGDPLTAKAFARLPPREDECTG